MPFISDWKPPRVAYLIDGFPIYYTYKNDECNIDEAIVSSYWFQIPINPEDRWDSEAWVPFDIRNLPQKGTDEEVLRGALVTGELQKLTGIRIEFPLSEKKWSMEVIRTSSRKERFELLARSIEEARKRALEQAPDFDFSDGVEMDDVTYEADGCPL
jgi:hypothetical protein